MSWSGPLVDANLDATGGILRIQSATFFLHLGGVNHWEWNGVDDGWGIRKAGIRGG